MSSILRKYATTSTVYFPLIGAGTVNFTSTATLTTADTKISIDGAAFATVGTAVTNVGSYGYSYSLTTANLTGKCITLVCVHTAGSKTFEDTMLLIETYGNSGAQHTFDLSIANQTVIASAGTVTLVAAQVVTIGTNNDKTGYSLSQTFPTNFADLSISATTGAVKLQPSQTVIASAGTTVASSISGITFPTNFADLSISATTGGVKLQPSQTVIASAGTVVASSITGVTFPTNFADLSITAATGLVSISTAATVNVGTIASAAVSSIWAISAVPSIAAPAWTASMLSTLSWVFGLSRNKITQTSVLQTVLQSDGATTLATSTLGDDGTTFTRGSFN